MFRLSTSFFINICWVHVNHLYWTCSLDMFQSSTFFFFNTYLKIMSWGTTTPNLLRISAKKLWIPNKNLFCQCFVIVDVVVSEYPAKKLWIPNKNLFCQCFDMLMLFLLPLPFLIDNTMLWFLFWYLFFLFPYIKGCESINKSIKGEIGCLT